MYIVKRSLVCAGAVLVKKHGQIQVAERDKRIYIYFAHLKLLLAAKHRVTELFYIRVW